MNKYISPNTQAILLLTAPLITGHGEKSSEYLTHWEYKKLARLLREIKSQPSDLLKVETNGLLIDISRIIEVERIKRLLARGFLLSQVIDRWQSRSIWVISRADSQYPYRLKERLKDDSPAVLYGCGDMTILNTGGLAVVGSRNVDDILIDYTKNIGGITAKANQTLISGGARGIDQAAMYGALEGGGKVAGVMADNLERASLERSYRTAFMNGQLVLISPYDPSAGFNVGHAMQRNKLIYGLSDAALVVSSDYNSGGTWAGAVEQLNKMKSVPLFVRTSGSIGKGLEQLLIMGAKPWPDPETPESLITSIKTSTPQKEECSKQADLFSYEQKEAASISPLIRDSLGATASTCESIEDEASSMVIRLLNESANPAATQEIADRLNIKLSKLRQCLKLLVEQGKLEKMSKPARYRICIVKQPSLFKLSKTDQPAKDNKITYSSNHITTEITND